MTIALLEPHRAHILRIAANTNLSPLGTFAKAVGGSVSSSLDALCSSGHLQEHEGRQRLGTRSVLFSITSKGRAALAAFEEHARHAGTPRSNDALKSRTGPQGGAEDEDRNADRPGPAAARAGSHALYTGAEMRWPSVRPGATDLLRIPSRVGDELHHRDGSVTPISSVR